MDSEFLQLQLSILIDGRTKEFMSQYPEHIAVGLFETAWREFRFNPTEQGQRELIVAMFGLMIASQGLVMFVSGDVREHDIERMLNESKCKTNYDDVTFH